MLNKVDLIGRLVRDPEYRALEDGTSVCNFTLAVDDDYKGKGGEKVTDFIDCTAWKQAAEFMTKYMSKGMMTAVSGRMKSRKWTDTDGNKRTSWYVKCDNVYSCESRKEAAMSERQQNTSPGAYAVPVYAGADYAELTDVDENMPF